MKMLIGYITAGFVGMAFLAGCTMTDAQRATLTNAGVQFAVLGVKKLNDAEVTNINIPPDIAETALAVCDFLQGDGAEFSGIVFDLAAGQINAAVAAASDSVDPDTLVSSDELRAHVATICSAIGQLSVPPPAPDVAA